MGKTEKKRKNVEQNLNRRETKALWEQTGRIPVRIKIMKYPFLTLYIRQLLERKVKDMIKGTVSPDIGYNFRVWKIKSLLSVEPLMIFTFMFYIVSDIFKLVS
jgi:hypothetical protein